MPQGTQGNDTLIGSHGVDDYLYGLEGDDWIEGGDETYSSGDELWGGAGNDTLLGGAGHDRLYADSGLDGGNDSLEGGAGFDVLVSWSGNDTLKGGLEGDSLQVSLESSEPRTVWVYGQDGDDYFHLGVTLATAAGSVRASGGAGQDTFRFDMSQDHLPRFAFGLVITDFQAGADGDLIDLHEILEFSGLHGRGYEGGNAFHDSQGYLRLVQKGADTLLQYDEDGVAGDAFGWHTAIRLQGVEASFLTADNLDGLPPDGTALPGQVIVGSAYDLVEGTTFDDTITGGGWGELRGNGGDDWIKAESGDRVYGGPGDDTLMGASGDDFLRGQAGDDVVRGGTGADRMQVRVGEGNDTLAGGDGDDVFEVFVGDASGPQVVRANGGEGNDRFHVSCADGAGGDDAVVVTGGAGQDTYVPWGTNEIKFTVTDFGGPDQLDARNLLQQAGGEGVYAEAIRGCLRLVQDGADVLLQFDWDGRGGDAHGWQTAITLQDLDVRMLSQYHFTAITGTGTLGADTLQGGFGADTLTGGGGNDLLDGAWGSDFMDGGTGNDRYVVDALSDQVIEGAGNGRDTVVAHVDYVLGRDVENLALGSGAFIGRGNALDNSMRGSGVDIQLHGRAGDDSLAGGEGADTLSGGTGADRLQGGAGLDVFRFTRVADSGVAVDARDVIVDFSRAAGRTTPGDKVDLSAIDAIAGSMANDTFTFIGNAQFSATDASGQLRFEYDAARACVVLYGSVDADGDAELAIELAGIGKIAAADLVL